MSETTNFRDLLKNNKPLKIVGAINAYCAILAKNAGHKCLYLSGSGVATASYGIPDLGLTSLVDVKTDAQRITNSCSLPLLVDIDTGWAESNDISFAIEEMVSAGVAAVHFEDQIDAKRCGHRPNKRLVSIQEMNERIESALLGKGSSEIFLIARTDALASEGLDGCIERAIAYEGAGAEALFLEAVTEINQYIVLKEHINIPILANITEFGKTPLFTEEQLHSAGVDMMLFPLSAFRAASRASQKVYETILKEGTQESLLDIMQTRDELYESLDYLNFEKNLDTYLENKENGNDKET